MIVVAGSDTTRVTITSIFYNLVCHPHTYQKLEDEADDFMQHRRGSTAENVENMPNQESWILYICLEAII